MDGEWFGGTVAGDETAQFPARRFNGNKYFARRRRKPFREYLEVIDERFHLRLHLFALRRDDARRIRLDRTFILDLFESLPDDLQAFAPFRDANQVPRAS